MEMNQHTQSAQASVPERKMMAVADFRNRQTSLTHTLPMILPGNRSFGSFYEAKIGQWMTATANFNDIMCVYGYRFEVPVVGLGASFLSYIASSNSPSDIHIKPFLVVDVTFDRRDNVFTHLLKVITSPFYEKTRTHLDEVTNEVILDAYARYANAKSGHGRTSPETLGRVQMFKITEVGNSSYFMILFGQGESAVAGMFNTITEPYIRVLSDNEL